LLLKTWKLFQTEILFYIWNTFQRSWKDGKEARLNLKCHDGQVWINLQLHIGHHPPHSITIFNQSSQDLLAPIARSETSSSSWTCKCCFQRQTAAVIAEVALQNKIYENPLKRVTAAKLAVLPVKTSGSHGLPPYQDIPAAQAGHVRQLPEQAFFIWY
jgi:hypothetical protein